MKYPAPGDPGLAGKVVELLTAGDASAQLTSATGSARQTQRETTRQKSISSRCFACWVPLAMKIAEFACIIVTPTVP